MNVVRVSILIQCVFHIYSCVVYSLIPLLDFISSFWRICPNLIFCEINLGHTLTFDPVYFFGDKLGVLPHIINHLVTMSFNSGTGNSAK